MTTVLRYYNCIDDITSFAVQKQKKTSRFFIGRNLYIQKKNVSNFLQNADVAQYD